MHVIVVVVVVVMVFYSLFLVSDVSLMNGAVKIERSDYAFFPPRLSLCGHTKLLDTKTYTLTLCPV